MSKIQKHSKLVTFVLSVTIIAALLPLMAIAETDSNIIIVGKGVTYTPKNEMGIIPWDRICAHSGNDGAFTPERSHFPENDRHIQLDGNDAYFYGYYTGWNSDYMYYKESDSTEKTFKFTMLFSIYPADGSNTPVAQRWHSLNSVGFLVNCVENDDSTISGCYVSFEPGYIVLRMLNHMDFDNLYEHSNLISGATELDRQPLETTTDTYRYEITASYEAFSVKKEGEEIFSFEVSAIDPLIIRDYTGGNDFGFYAGYVGSPTHTCNELSFAEFKDIELSTKSLIPTITAVNWNNGNGSGNGGGINQITVNGITLKDNKNYVEPENFDAMIAKTTLTKNDPTEIYTVIGKTVNNDDGQYEKVYDIKMALFEDGTWRVYAGLLSVDNPGGNVKA